DPERSLQHRELSVRHAFNDDDKRRFLVLLANQQEALKRYTAAISSLRELIALNPTSSEVKTWKERIASLRQEFDIEERKRSIRERLHERGELPLPTLAVEMLRAAGFSVKNATAVWLEAISQDRPQALPIVLLGDPELSEDSVREALDALPPE